MEALDTHVPPPKRDITSPFLFPIESAFNVKNRGTVAVGTLVRGRINRLDNAEILGHGTHLKAVLSDIQVQFLKYFW